MKLELPYADVLDRKPTDGRGRVTLGSEYADREVVVAVVEVHDK